MMKEQAKAEGEKNLDQSPERMSFHSIKMLASPNA
jgi:hypothetical protein